MTTPASPRRVPALVGAAVLAAAAVIGGCSTGGSNSAPPAAPVTVATATTTTAAPIPTTTTSTTVPPSAHAPGSAVSIPTVEGPVEGGTPDVPVNAMPAGWADQYGYAEHEFFVHGTAHAYVPTAPFGRDGRWRVRSIASAPYRTRMLVRVPTDASRFNGVVVVEWLDESTGRDADPDFAFAGAELLREGYAYVGVSAQMQGLVGGGAGAIPGTQSVALSHQNAARYRHLVHPGDDYSYDIFSQAAQALWRPRGVSPLGLLRPRAVLAMGESDAAAHLVTYYNAIAPIARVYQGFLIHSRGAGNAPIAYGPFSRAVPPTVELRSDGRVPVLALQTETDLFGFGSYAVRQPDSGVLRTWEMAGTSPVDRTSLDYDAASRDVWDPNGIGGNAAAACGSVNDGPQRYFVRSAVAALTAWVTKHTPPVPAPPFLVHNGAIARDPLGNALLGAHLPQIDVPSAAFDGTLVEGRGALCARAGHTRGLSAALLHGLYTSHDDYVTRFEIAAGQAVQHGFLLATDAEEVIAAARAARSPNRPVGSSQPVEPSGRAVASRGGLVADR